MTPERILSRFVQADDMGDPKDLLGPFEGVLGQLRTSIPEAEAARKTLETFLADRRSGPSDAPLAFSPAVAEARKTAEQAFYSLAARVNLIVDAGHKLFLAILQKLALAPALRKKVEKASRTYLKRFRVKGKSYGLEREIEYLTIYIKFAGVFFADLAVAKEAIASGKEHSAEGAEATKFKVGGFTLINTGGFSKQVMDTIVEVMTKAETLARSSGLGQVCYGEVQVTNTLSKGNTLAFYLPSKDALFIRANVKGDVDTVRTVLHELGHRYDHKFLKNDHGVEKLYQILSGEEIDYGLKLRDKKPATGEVWTSPKGDDYKVLGIERTRGKDMVYMQSVSNPKATARISLEGFLEQRDQGTARDLDRPDYKGFVSQYAKSGGPTENFAEMFAYYCLSRLPVAQSVPFEALVFGGPEAATFRFARRILARFLLGEG